MVELANKELSKVRNSAIRLLKSRSRSEHELRERLKRKNFSNQLIDQTITFLLEKHFIDDRQFTRSWIQDRLLKPYGKKRIILELIKKGISNKLITEELSNVTINEESILLALAQKRLSRYKGLDTPTRNRRLFQYLAYRGFDIESIQHTIEHL